MLLAGIASFYIAYVTLPLFYIMIGISLNFIYTLGWISELILSYSVSQEKKRHYAPKAFMIMLVFSLIIVFGFSLFLVLR